MCENVESSEGTRLTRARPGAVYEGTLICEERCLVPEWDEVVKMQELSKFLVAREGELPLSVSLTNRATVQVPLPSASAPNPARPTSLAEPIFWTTFSRARPNLELNPGTISHARNKRTICTALPRSRHPLLPKPQLNTTRASTCLYHHPPPSMSFLGFGRPQPSSAEKIAAVEAEMKLMADMMNRYASRSGSHPLLLSLTHD